MATPVSLHRDKLFLAAMLLGPLYWLLLAIQDTPDLHWHKPFAHPWWFLQLAVIYPVLEELVFRGLLQGLVRDLLGHFRIGPLTLANAITSMLFALAHLYYNPAPVALLVFFPSLVFGYFRERTGALTASILLHGFYNAGLAWLYLAPE